MKKKHVLIILPYLLLLFLGTYAMWSLTIPGLYKAHDTTAHISRLIAFQEGLQDGQFPPRWAGYFFGGLGSPVLILNYSLPYFLASAIHTLGFSLFDSYKLTLALSYIASGIAAYIAFKTIFGKLPGFIGAILYMWAPYRFLDIFVRSAFGESLSFMFPPLILLAIHRQWWLLLVISFAGLFLTHPVASAFFCLFFFPYALLYFYQQKKLQNFSIFFLCFLLAIGISAYNIFPSLFETYYTHYAPSNSEPLRHFPSIMQLIRSPWGYGYSEANQNDWLSFQLGIAQWIVIVISSYFLLRVFVVKKAHAEAIRVALVLLVAWSAIFLMTPNSIVVWKLIDLSKIIDFPWRLTLLVVFLAAYLGSWLTARLRGTWGYLFVILLVFLALYGNRNHLNVIETLPYNEAYFRASDQTGDDWGEYASIYRKTKTSTRLQKRIQVLRGDASVQTVTSKSHSITSRVRAQEQVLVRINVMYFPGWRVELDSKVLGVGKQCQITTRRTSKADMSGLLICTIPKGNHILHVEFGNTPLRVWSNLITSLSLFFFLCLTSLWLFQHITKRKISSLSSGKSPASSKRKRHGK